MIRPDPPTYDPDRFDPLELPCRVCDAAPRQACLWIDRGRWTFRHPHHQRVTAARALAAARRTVETLRASSQRRA